MKVIDIDEIIAIIDKKFDEVIYETLNKNNAGWGDVCMFPNTRELFNLKIALINRLNTLKIIEESKEDELEEIEKITIRDNNTLGFPNGSWTPRNMDIAFSYKINKLIVNQNKILKELKDNKGNE